MRSRLYVSSLDQREAEPLRRLEERMRAYYRNGAYHGEWIKGHNVSWRPGSHDAQIALCQRVPTNSVVLEVGCGDGGAGAEIVARVPGVRYVGIDLNPKLGKETRGLPFVSGSGAALPFRPASFDVVVSMFVIEHVVFPARFLESAWAILRPHGRVLIVAPDFSRNAMASERMGLSYGSGREKAKRGKVLDALLTTYDTRVRLNLLRYLRRRRLSQGRITFPVLLEPRCLQLSGFVPDCDAVYPSCPEEITSYLETRDDFSSSDIFYRDGHTFGLMVVRR